MIKLTPVVSRVKVKKLALSSQLLTVQILSNDVQVLILCLSYFFTSVHGVFFGNLQFYFLVLFATKLLHFVKIE